MPRKLRVQYPGAIYHLMSRGDRREDIFADDRDRERFLETLEETCRKTGWQILAITVRSYERPTLNMPKGWWRRSCGDGDGLKAS